MLRLASMVSRFFEIFRDRLMLDHVKSLTTWQDLKAYIVDEITSNVVELKVLLRQKSLSVENPRC